MNCLTEEAWHTFCSILQECEKKYVLKRKKRKQQPKPIWMSHKALKLLRKKYKAYGKYKNVDHPAYKKAAHTAKEELRKARHNFESKLAQNVRSDKKTFSAYMGSKSK